MTNFSTFGFNRFSGFGSHTRSNLFSKFSQFAQKSQHGAFNNFSFNPGRFGGGHRGGSQPSAPAPTGQILGGTTAPGAMIDPVKGDFTRNGGNVPIASVNVEELHRNPDGTSTVRVNVSNTGPQGGTFLTPTFVSIQDGKFDIYDSGKPASEFLERLAEDGATDPIQAAFDASGAIGASGVVTGPDGVAGPLDTGETGSITLTIDPKRARYLNFASMVIPSNDAFIASPDNSRALRIFDGKGNFTGGTFEVKGRDVLDAGTEVNTEQDAAFLNQTGPDTGEDENGRVGRHPGFIGSEGTSRGRGRSRSNHSGAFRSSWWRI